MQSTSRLLLSLAAVAACATAYAAPYDGEDQARRDRNRAEIMTKHGLDSTTYRADGTVRVEEKKTVQGETQRAVNATKRETRRAVNATKGFGHRTADKMRDIGDKANAKFPGQAAPAKDPYNHGPK